MNVGSNVNNVLHHCSKRSSQRQRRTIRKTTTIASKPKSTGELLYQVEPSWLLTTTSNEFVKFKQHTSIQKRDTHICKHHAAAPRKIVATQAVPKLLPHPPLEHQDEVKSLIRASSSPLSLESPSNIRLDIHQSQRSRTTQTTTEDIRNTLQLLRSHWPQYAVPSISRLQYHISRK